MARAARVRGWAAAGLLWAAGAAVAAGGQEPSVPALLRDASSSDAARRREALAALLLRAPRLDGTEARSVAAAAAGRLEGERDPDARALALTLLGRTGGGAAAEPLLRALAGETEPGPQAALVDAFADLPAEAVAEPLSRVCFGDGNVTARTLGAAALGRVPGDRALRALLALGETTLPWPVAAAVVESMGLRGDRRAVDLAVARLADPDPAVRVAARIAAERLLGRDLGDDPAAWRGAWQAEREGWVPPGSRPPVEGALSAPTLHVDVRTVARFYDVPVAGRRVAFVMDCSQSMWGGKMETAKAELLAAIKGLRPGQRFALVFFNERVWTWREAPAPATPAMKWSAAEAVAALPTRSYTNIHDSLERAFGWCGEGRFAVADPPGLDELFFLSDGEPNRGRLRDPERIAEAVAGWNARGRVRIHTVALGEHPAALLARLAADGGGTAVRRP